MSKVFFHTYDTERDRYEIMSNGDRFNFLDDMLWRELNSEDQPKDSFTDRLDSLTHVIGVWQKQELMGFATLSQWFSPVWVLATSFLHPDIRGQHHWLETVKLRERIAISNGATIIESKVVNPKLVKPLKRRGYQFDPETRTYRVKVGDLRI